MTATEVAFPTRPAAGSNSGERNPAAKLTEYQAWLIREAAAEGAIQVHLARAFGVSSRAVRHIAQGTTWRTMSPAAEQEGGQ